MLARTISRHAASRPAFAMGFATKKSDAEILHDSLSDGHYDISSTPSRPPAMDRPLSNDVRVVRARATYNSLSDPGPTVLHDSLSEGNYGLPPSLLATTRPAFKRAQGHRSAGPFSLPMLQRVSAFPPRHSMSDPQPLHNSYSHVDYTERRK